MRNNLCPKQQFDYVRVDFMSGGHAYYINNTPIVRYVPFRSQPQIVGWCAKEVINDSERPSYAREFRRVRRMNKLPDNVELGIIYGE